MKVLTKITIVFLCVLLASATAAAAYYFIATRDTRLEAEKFSLAQNCAVILDNSDHKVSEINFSQKHKTVNVAKIPSYVKDAFISAEDKNFYSHHGLDYKRMLRAALTNLRAGSFKQGASTISQQLVKNTQLSNEKTLARKLKEIKLTLQLEKKYSKDEILEMYLNTIYFGHTCYGIAEAADFYFGKEPSELTLPEGAMLAAVIRSPNNYSPFTNSEKCLNARNSVLRRMFTLGKISESEYEKAENQPLPQPREKSFSSDSYLDAVYEEFQNLPLFSPYKLREGFRIYTYMDETMQEYIRQLSTDADRSGKSLIVCNNQTRGVSAFFSTEGNLRRQPGSAVKPLAVYAPALEENLISPCTPICDEATDFGGYAPANYHDKYCGWISVQDALAQSLNIPAVKILNELGIEKSCAYLQRLNLPVLDTDKNLSLALGGMTEGFTLPELSAAYAAFANGGQFAPVAFIRKVESEDGEILYERNPIPIRAFSSDTACLTNKMLHSCVQNGTAKKLNILPFEVCAKTGTSGTEKGNTDAWTISYTTLHTVGVWMGNADNSLTNITGGGLPCHYAMLILKKQYQNSAPQNFTDDPDIVTCTLDKIAYDKDHILRLASQNQPTATTFTELFRKSNCPKDQTSDLITENCSLRLENNTVMIDLCQTEYYNYLIKRENRSKTKTIFDGKANASFHDKTVKAGEKYVYTVCPYSINDKGERIYGKEIRLPAVIIPKTPKDIPDNWWEH